MSAIGQVTGPALPSCVRGCTNLFVRMPRARQRGSMAVTMMLMLVGLVAMLGLVEIGYLYWAKRETQKVVDLAALAGAQQLTACSTDNSSNSAALGNARIDNGFSDTLVITCGHWDPTQAGAQHFVSVTSSLPLNAVRVEATLPVTPFFGFARFDGINATAIAASQGQPIAAFSVGSSLLNIDPSSPLGTLLGTALGSSLGLQLLSYNGIANANISLLGLVKALPVDIGTVNSVLTTQVTVTDLLTAYVNALSQSSSASTIDLAFVNQQVAAIELQLGNIPINLGQILNVDATTEDPNVALNVDVNALDILSAVVLAADGANAVALPATSISIPGVATISLALSIVEPPQIGVGGVGTVAHTAEIRLDLDVTALSTPINGQQLLDLPLYLEVAPTDGTITAIECNVPGSGGANSDSVTITAAPGVLNAFLGKLPSAAFNNTSQSWSSLISSGSLAQLVNVLNLATISASANVQLAANPATALTFSVDPTIPVSQQSGMTQTAGTSSAVLGNLIGSLLGSTSLNVTINLLGLPINLAPVASLLATLSTALAPVLSSLDSLLVGPLLQALGINIGTAQVSLLSVNCNTTPQLVY
ncbi:TadG family pilus assembly protein [Rhodanobacter sp. A1T4]|uniref:TadG family pilus assembly protein n=1 Tax=Rhodanobacter sp. A1T4 TaxID=2723087 RepID=UPI0016104F5D|nr:TadG family pilus assembly protein [Rhodanobacter sp. A1T4]MBB6249365.1 putative membrane protein [Rhodanobacter sp. A1T4]